jgi:transposase-like protein
MEEETKSWAAKRKAALVVEIIQAKTTIAQASRVFGIASSEIEDWVDEAKKGIENDFRAKSMEIKEQYGRQFKELMHTARQCWSSELDKSCHPCWVKTRSNSRYQAGYAGRGNSSNHDQAMCLILGAKADDLLQKS